MNICTWGSFTSNCALIVSYVIFYILHNMHNTIQVSVTDLLVSLITPYYSKSININALSVWRTNQHTIPTNQNQEFDSDAE